MLNQSELVIPEKHLGKFKMGKKPLGIEMKAK